MSRFSVKVQGLDTYLQTLNKVNGNIRGAIDTALINTHELITNQIKEALTKGVPIKSGGTSKPINIVSKGSGNMARSFLDEIAVDWYGDRAFIRVGFDQSESMHATYMMITGTAYTKPSKKLYNAIYGAATKKKVAEIQKQALIEAIEEAMR